MAPWLFADSILCQRDATIFCNGEMRRDFTYIDDVVVAINKIIATEIKSDCEIYNIGSSNPHSVWELYNAIEENLNMPGKYQMRERQSGDVLNTYADMTKFNRDFGPINYTQFSDGIKQFCKWFKEYKEYY